MLNPLKLPFEPDAVQVNKVPATELLRAIFVATPLQTLEFTGVAVASGTGLIVTSTFMGVPAQFEGAGPTGVIV